MSASKTRANGPKGLENEAKPSQKAMNLANSSTFALSALSDDLSAINARRGGVCADLTFRLSIAEVLRILRPVNLAKKVRAAYQFALARHRFGISSFKVDHRLA